MPTSTSPLRETPLQVGLVTCTRPAYPTVSCGIADAHDAYDARIMHRPVPASLATWTVVVDASDSDLANALRLAEHDVRAFLLTSRTPLVDPRPCTERPRRFCDATPSRARAAPLALSTLQHFRDVAADLRSRLSFLTAAAADCTPDGTAPTRSRARYYARPAAAVPVPVDDSPASSSASDVASLEPGSSSPGCCAHAERGSHILCVSDGSRALVRAHGGLYAGARHTRPLAPGERAYAELHVLYAGGAGGLAVGLAPASAPLDKLVGAQKATLALHSAARIIVAGEWRDCDNIAARPFGTGDVVGVLCSVALDGAVVARFSVNGTPVADVKGDQAIADAARAGDRIHLAVSLLRPGARVAIRCCPADWHYSPFLDDPAGASPLCNPRSSVPCKNRADATSAVLTP